MGFFKVGTRSRSLDGILRLLSTSHRSRFPKPTPKIKLNSSHRVNERRHRHAPQSLSESLFVPEIGERDEDTVDLIPMFAK